MSKDLGQVADTDESMVVNEEIDEVDFGSGGADVIEDDDNIWVIPEENEKSNPDSVWEEDKSWVLSDADTKAIEDMAKSELGEDLGDMTVSKETETVADVDIDLGEAPVKENKVSKVLGLLMSLAGIAILVVLLAVVYLNMFGLGKDEVEYTYNEDKNVCIEKSNISYINFMEKNYIGSNMTVSPLSVQKAIYDLHEFKGNQDPSLFLKFDNGYKDWVSSKELYNYDCIESLIVGEGTDIPSDISLIRDKISESTETSHESKLKGEYLIENNAIAIFSLKLDLDYDCKQSNLLIPTVEFVGDVEHKVEDDVMMTKLSANNGKYFVYLIADKNGSSNFKVPNTLFEDDYETVKCGFSLFNVDRTLSGVPNVLLNEMKVDEPGVLMDCYFSFGEYEDKEKDDDAGIDHIMYHNNFMYIVTDSETGQILLLGTMFE